MKNENFMIQSSLAVQARDALRERIITGQLAPGERIELSELASRWKISPTPLRDAVKALEGTGLVDILPRRGVFVAQLDRKGLRETFELRMAFEGMAARLAVRNLPGGVAEAALRAYREAGEADAAEQESRLEAVDELVHDIVLAHSGNQRLAKMMAGVADLVRWSRLSIVRHIPRSYLTTLPEHVAICEALIARDPDAAEATMRRHLEKVSERIEKWLDENPSENSV